MTHFPPAVITGGSTATVYVSAAGNDTAIGTIRSAPKASVQAAHDALPATGGRIVVLGTVHSGTPIVFTKQVALIGEDNAQLTATAGHLFSVTTDWTSNVVSNITLAASAGHIIDIATGHSINLSRFDTVDFAQYGDGYSVVNMPDGGMVDNLFLTCQSTHTLTATVPSWNLRSSTGALNANLWLRHRHTNSGNYAFHLESTAAQSSIYDNVLRQVTFEVCNGGAVRLLSAMACVIDQASVWDLSAPAARDLFVVGKSVAAGNSVGNSLRHVGRRGGSLGSGVVDVRLTSGQVASTVLEQSFDAALNSFTADLGGTTGTIIGRAPASLLNADSFTDLSPDTGWSPYTPTLGGTGAALGNGTASGAWTRTGRTVTFWARVDRGSTTTWGTAGARLTLPVQAADQNSLSAGGIVFRTGVNSYAAAILPGAAPVTDLVVAVIGNGGAYSVVTDTAPWAAAAGDYLLIQGTYQAAA